MLGATNVTGTVPCELFENHELRSLMISVNPLEGSLPACVLEVSSSRGCAATAFKCCCCRDSGSNCQLQIKQQLCVEQGACMQGVTIRCRWYAGMAQPSFSCFLLLLGFCWNRMWHLCVVLLLDRCNSWAASSSSSSVFCATRFFRGRCSLQSTTLEELYMSRLPLTGDLPDSFSPDSQLRVWYAINKDPVSGDAAGPGFTGSIPSSLSNVAHLAFVELSHHQLTGGVPQLPARMRMAEFQSNQLDGSIACEWRPLAGLARYMCQCKCRCCCNRAVFVLQSQFGVASS
eukprot:GHRQ01028125.1.p1 GENE.GHRQ01028125.1~~GHRQ01028125.1.p1  ORF type:complete len:288 (-),score=80.04 GHRQ01028125.1:459-1322(-)